MSMRWEIEIGDDISLFEDSWRALEASGCCSAFQGFDWSSIWYRTIKRHDAAEPVIIAARRAGTPGIEVILPMCRIRRSGYWEIAFADMGVTDFAGPVFLPDALANAGAVDGLMAAISKALPRGDIIRLNKICPDIAGRRNPLRDLSHLVPFPVGLWGMPLSPDQSAEPPKNAKRRVFRKTAQKSQELSARFTRRFEWIEDGEGLRRAFDHLVELRIARSTEIERPEILREPMWLDFYRTLVEAPGGKLRVAIATITADGETIAAALGVGYRRAFHYLVPGFAMAGWAQYNPGLQLVFDLMRECPARDMDYLDLTIGDERYKKDVGAERRPLFETRLPVTFKGHLIFLAWRLKIALKAHPRLSALIDRLRGRPTCPAGARRCPSRVND